MPLEKSTAEDLKDSGKNYLRRAEEGATDRFEHATDSVARGGRQIMDRAGEAYSQAQDAVERATKTGASYVRHKPVQSLLGALAVGFLIGLVSRRR